MIKIKSIQFKKYPVLGDLCLDFCDNNGNPADTIIIAGENGTGKTTVLEEIHKIMKYECDCKDLKLEVLCDGVCQNIKYGEFKYLVARNDGRVEPVIYDTLVNGKEAWQHSIQRITKFRSIYSTVNINFIRNNNHSTNDVLAELSTVEKNVKNKKSDANLANDIVNSLLRIRADDTEQLNRAYENGNDLEEIKPQLDRFKNAFNYMFDNKLEFEGVEQNKKNILFKNKQENKPFSIDNLSSGEKQIVFRGAFLLQDKETLNGAVVLIDEPEISMHPKWQQKILDYYRNLFIDSNGKQTSQIIISTHSNFVIENAVQKIKQRENVVIICLKKNNQVTKITRNGTPFILPTVTAAEINYHVFNIASTDYHIQLFGYFQSITKITQIKDIDDKIKNNQSLLSKNVLQDSKGNACQWVYGSKTYDTICCFIRNAIDHPDNLLTQTKKEYIDDLQYSIEILIELIKLAKSSSLK